MNNIWMGFTERLDVELQQSTEEGKDTIGYIEKIQRIKDLGSEKREIEAARLLDEMIALTVKGDFPYVEPSEYEEILLERSEGPRMLNKEIVDRALYDKILGAWLGRSCGCLLGQPVEGWKRERINGFAKETGNYPVKSYFSSDIPDQIREKYDVRDNRPIYSFTEINWVNNIDHMVEDDDMNYTIIGLKIMEEFGMDFSSDNVAEAWLTDLPVLRVCTAERVAYQNLINLIPVPHSAKHRNSYREWVGAQIRGDIFGYVTPGNPELGAQLAYRNARVSHVKNGIYGEMWVAAMLSAAFFTDNIEEIINIGLSEIPYNSRFRESIAKVLDWKNSGVNDWEAAIDKVHEIYDEDNPHDWCHTISNAMIVSIALMYGEKDFSKTLSITSLAGFDTDSNGATVGSVLGLVLGSENIPCNWTSPLNDTIVSGVHGFMKVKISDLAKRTVKLAGINKVYKNVK